MSFYIWLAWFAELGLTTMDKSSKYLRDLYLITFAENSWVISNTGQFVDRKFFQVNEASNDYWAYTNNSLVHLNKADSRMKRMPYLSCLFNYDGREFSMDEFLDDTRCNDNEGLTLPILMAAFTLHQKRLHNWHDAKFNALNRDGVPVSFTGGDSKLKVE
jgi:hypothetical protein